MLELGYQCEDDSDPPRCRYGRQSRGKGTKRDERRRCVWDDQQGKATWFLVDIRMTVASERCAPGMGFDDCSCTVAAHPLGSLDADAVAYEWDKLLFLLRFQFFDSTALQYTD
jgi:hypothetical protein